MRTSSARKGGITSRISGGARNFQSEGYRPRVWGHRPLEACSVVYRRLRITTNAQEHFTTFRRGASAPIGGGKCPPIAHACGRPWLYSACADIWSKGLVYV